jgi:hypothetical protein
MLYFLVGSLIHLGLLVDGLLVVAPMDHILLDTALRSLQAVDSQEIQKRKTSQLKKLQRTHPQIPHALLRALPFSSLASEHVLTSSPVS